MARIIGIDLGTTNSCVATLEDGQLVVIPNTGGYKTTPSMMAVTDNGKRLVGHLAKRQAITNSKNTVFAAKRLIGRGFDSAEIQRAQALLPYEIVEGPNNDARVRINERDYTIPEISAVVLREMKRVAEEHFGEKIEQAVITVPAYFNDAQRQTTKDAAQIAGLDVLRMINEPTSAALSYGFGRADTGKFAVYDLGGGTFDISILQMNDGVIEVLATEGDTYLGGEDFDRHIVEHLVQAFWDDNGLLLENDTMAIQRLKDAAEKAKCELSELTSTEINLPFIANDAADQPLHLSTVLERNTLNELIGPLLERTRKICESALNEAGVSASEIDQVILVGGQTRTPLVQEMVAEIFGQVPSKGVNPDEAVATGAAIQASMLGAGEAGPLLVDVTPLSLGIATAGGNFARIIERNSTIPTARQEIFTTTRDNQKAVKIKVLQGESDKACENDLLGEFVLTGVRTAPKGEPEIEVTFDIDASGIVSVAAHDIETDQEQSIQVNPRGTLTPDEVKKLADEYADDDIELKD